MYKLLLIDDEKQIRDGLKKLVDWEDYGIEICGEAGNGQEALTIVRDVHPQIIFTDIRMPHMDGIEFLEKLKETEENAKVVVLSGYDDFTLVRQAMRNGAVDYILKPSGKNEIAKIIEEIIDNIEDEINSKINNNEKMKLLKTNVMNRMIRREILSIELRSKLELLEMDLSQGAFSVAIVEIAEKAFDEVKMEEGGRVWKTFAICNVCEEMVETTGKGIVFTDTAGNVVIIFKNIDVDDIKFGIGDILSKMMKYIVNVLKISISIAVGNIAKTQRNIATSYDEAIKTKEYQFVFGSECVLYYDEIKRYFCEENNVVEIDGNTVKELVQKGNYSAIEEYVKDLFGKYNKKVAIANCYVLRNYALEILILAYQCFETMPMIEKNKVLHMKEAALQAVAFENSLSSMQSRVLISIREIIDEMKQSWQKNYSKIVFDAIQTIQKSYFDVELSLQYLADCFHVNTAYLGRMFKKETGSSFTDYLSTVRVERAKELLISTNYKGSELCEKVGFSNYNYFYIVFKKITGQSPMGFRK